MSFQNYDRVLLPIFIALFSLSTGCESERVRTIKKYEKENLEEPFSSIQECRDFTRDFRPLPSQYDKDIYNRICHGQIEDSTDWRVYRIEDGEPVAHWGPGEKVSGSSSYEPVLDLLTKRHRISGRYKGQFHKYARPKERRGGLVAEKMEDTIVIEVALIDSKQIKLYFPDDEGYPEYFKAKLQQDDRIQFDRKTGEFDKGGTFSRECEGKLQGETLSFECKSVQKFHDHTALVDLSFRGTRVSPHPVY